MSKNDGSETHKREWLLQTMPSISMTHSMDDAGLIVDLSSSSLMSLIEWWMHLQRLKPSRSTHRYLRDVLAERMRLATLVAHSLS